MRVDRRTAKHRATIPVGGHPTSVAVLGDTVWVWTVEGLLVPIDPRFDVAGEPIDLRAAGARSGHPEERNDRLGRLAVAGGYLWLTVPRATLIRGSGGRPRAFEPPNGVEGPLAAGNGSLWVGGFSEVFPVAASGIEGAGVRTGLVRDLAVGAGSLWVASGQETGQQGVRSALRRVDPRSRLIRSTIAAGVNPVAVEVAAGSVWLASETTVRRVDPADDRVTAAIGVGASVTDLAGDTDGVWVAVK